MLIRPVWKLVSVITHHILYILRKWYLWPNICGGSWVKPNFYLNKIKKINSVSIKLLVASNVSRISLLTGLSYWFMCHKSVCAALLLLTLKKTNKLVHGQTNAQLLPERHVCCNKLALPIRPKLIY